MGDSTRGDGPFAGARSRAPDVRPRDPRGEPSAFNFERSKMDSPADQESVAGLLRDLVHQGAHLAEQQTKLVQAEVRAAVTELTTAVAAMAGAGVVAIAGVGVFLMGISFLLARALPLWAATLIVAVATMILAYGMFTAGRKKLENSALDLPKTRRTLERTPAAVAGKSEGRSNDR